MFYQNLSKDINYWYVILQNNFRAASIYSLQWSRITNR